MIRLKKAFWFVVASIFLIEAWLWDLVQPVIHRIVDVLPLRRLKAMARWLVTRLPAWATLLVMGLPGIVLIPAKLLGIWLLARGQLIAGIGLFILAKSVGVVLTVFLFEICRPKLMEMAWFAKAYGWFVATRAWAHAQIAPYRTWLAELKLRALGEKSGFSRRFAALRRRSRPR